MNRALFASLLALAASGCAYRPEPTEVIRIVDTPADVRTCRNLGQVSSPVITTGDLTVTRTRDFKLELEDMLKGTVTLGGTDLLLQKQSHDWLVVTGVAFDCNRVRGRVRERVVVRAAG